MTQQQTFSAKIYNFGSGLSKKYLKIMKFALN